MGNTNTIINSNLETQLEEYTTTEILYDNLLFTNLEQNQEPKQIKEKESIQYSTLLYETRKFKLFNKYEIDDKNILSMYKILDKYYNLTYKLLSENKKKEIYEKILMYHTSSKFIDKKIYKNINNNNFQYLAYFYYYLGKALKILNEIVNNTYNLDIIEEAKNNYIKYQHYLENRLEKQHNKELWIRVNKLI
jgi:hypothetical protein